MISSVSTPGLARGLLRQSHARFWRLSSWGWWLPRRSPSLRASSLIARFTAGPFSKGTFPVAALLGALLLSACGPSTEDRLVIFAAASLASAFDQVEESYETSVEGLPLEINYGASQTLRVQIREGAYADVFASADAIEMEQAVAEGLVRPGDPVLFVRNRLALILPPGNPAGLAQPADLARPGVRVAMADESVPLGRYTRDLLQRLAEGWDLEEDFPQQVLANVVSFELSASGVLGKIRSGEVDGGIGYASDLAGSGAGLSTLLLPEGVSPTADYYAAPIAASGKPEPARAFTLWLLRPEARAILGAAGFVLPPGP